MAAISILTLAMSMSEPSTWLCYVETNNLCEIAASNERVATLVLVGGRSSPKPQKQISLSVSLPSAPFRGDCALQFSN